MGKVAYKLRLPDEVNMHPVFHLFLLKKSIEPHAAISPDLPNMNEEEGVVEPQAHTGQKGDLSRFNAPNSSASQVVSEGS